MTASAGKEWARLRRVILVTENIDADTSATAGELSANSVPGVTFRYVEAA